MLASSLRLKKILDQQMHVIGFSVCGALSVAVIIWPCLQRAELSRWMDAGSWHLLTACVCESSRTRLIYECRDERRFLFQARVLNPLCGVKDRRVID